MVNHDHIHSLLKKMQHFDSDERYMATSDLTTALSTVDGLLDQSLQVPIRNAILKQLDDKSIEVQAVAVKCLATLVQKFHANQVVDIVDKMGQLIVSTEQKQESRDIYSIGLQTIVGSVREEDGAASSEKLVTSLVRGFKEAAKEQNDKLTITCMDIVKDVMNRFGDKVTNTHAELLQVLSSLLEHPKESVRKRASVTLGALVRHFNDELFQKLMENVISKIESSGSAATQAHILETYIQTIGVISVNAGVRVGRYLPKIVPQLQAFCTIPEDSVDEKRIDLWENCFQAFESVITRCPNEMTPYLPDVVKLCIKFMAHDPNYSYDVEMEDENDNDWGDDDEEEEQGYEDDVVDQDDDSSWKVRRAAVRTLNAFITTRSDILKDFYQSMASHFVERFKERDHNVKTDIFRATTNLLKEAVVSGNDQEEKGTLKVPVLIRQRSSYDTLGSKLNDIVAAIESQTQSDKIDAQKDAKKALFDVIQQLLLVMRADLRPHFQTLLPFVIKSASDKDATIRSDALSLLHLFIEMGDMRSLQSFVAEMFGVASEAMKDTYTRTKAEALRLAGALVPTAASEEFKGESLSVKLFDSTHEVFVVKDMDLEVKEASITTMSIILSRMGTAPELKGRTEACLPVFVERLSNEVTRLPALRAIGLIASSGHSVDLTAVMDPIIVTLCKFLKQQSQALRHETVRSLTALVQNPAFKMSPPLYAQLMAGVTVHIGDSDLHLSHLVLDLVAAVLRVDAAMPDESANDLVARILEFLRSPLLQGNALTSLIRLFEVFMATTQSKALSFDALYPQLISDASADSSKACLGAIAQCSAAMVSKLNQARADTCIELLLATIRLPETETHVLQVSLLTLGEIGLRCGQGQTSHFTGKDNMLMNVFSCFEHKEDDVQVAASHALANITVGNMKVHLSAVLALVKERENQQYYLLHAIKEVINAHIGEGTRDFDAYTSAVIPVLLEHAEQADEGVRMMVAECLGRLAIIDADQIIPKMETMVKSENAHARGVVVTALRFALSPLPSNTELLRQRIPLFLTLLKDPDLAVRRAAIQTCNALVHSSLDLLEADVLRQVVLPVLYENTTQNKDLIRLVDYGWFKQEEDDGLPLRKAAFQALETVLNVAPHRLDMKQYIGYIRQGLIDQDDLQILTYQILNHIAIHHGNSLLEVLDNLPPTIKTGVMGQLKAAKGEKPERAKDVLRSSVRAMYQISQISGVEQCPKFVDFYKRVLKTALLAQMLKELKEAQ